MKKIFLIILAAIVVTSIRFTAFAQENKAQTKVIVYYFHGSFRCFTCTNMEKYSREAIEANFADNLKSGALEFKEINVEERGNEHFASDYKLYTKSLILSLVKDGKEVNYKNLDKIWELARNKQKFIEYVSNEVNEFIKGAQ
jgi:hypothetical protein